MLLATRLYSTLHNLPHGIVDIMHMYKGSGTLQSGLNHTNYGDEAWLALY